jgi:hypothetical protein
LYVDGGAQRLGTQLLGSGGNAINVYGPVASVTVNTTYHGCVTYDGSRTAAGTHVYLNGTEGAHNVPVDNLSSSIANTKPVYIGALYGTPLASYFPGAIADTRIYDVALTSAQVAALYAAGPQ